MSPNMLRPWHVWGYGQREPAAQGCAAGSRSDARLDLPPDHLDGDENGEEELNEHQCVLEGDASQQKLDLSTGLPFSSVDELSHSLRNQMEQLGVRVLGAGQQCGEVEEPRDYDRCGERQGENVFEEPDEDPEETGNSFKHDETSVGVIPVLPILYN